MSDILGDILSSYFSDTSCQGDLELTLFCPRPIKGQGQRSAKASILMMIARLMNEALK